tara:strand:+ start:218 stop:760 length:543 start_codon:yes stop_codon:yes gene_type:complete
MNFTYAFAKNLFSREKIKNLNLKINENFINSSDSAASDAVKTSSVKFVKLGAVENLINPFLQFCYQANTKLYGFDLYPLTKEKILNYNIYEKGTEYGWHTDGTEGLTSDDIKLTCLLNCSEDNYLGANLSLFTGGERKCEEFNIPGSAVVFPSFINHRVDKLISGKRNTLAIWMYGSRFK